MARLVIFTEAADWHTRQLSRACRSRKVDVRVLSLKQGGFALGRGGTGLALEGFASDELPDWVMVRVVAAGSFEQVTLRLGLLHALEALGVPVVNPARIIERCVDKSMTSFLLQTAGVPTLPTWVTENREEAERIVASAPGDLVFKPLFGAMGRYLRRVPAGGEVPDLPAYCGVWYVQKMIERPGPASDFRVLVVGDRAVAAMRRESAGWITNVARGATCHPIPAEGDLATLAVASARAVGAAYAGVDLIADEAGQLFVLEVNSMPAWKGLQTVTPFDIAQCLVDHVVGSHDLVAA